MSMLLIFDIICMFMDYIILIPFILIIFLVLVSIIIAFILNVIKFFKYRFITSPNEFLEPGVPYVISGRIYSEEDSLTTPASRKPCVYYSYETWGERNVFIGKHTTKLYLKTSDGLKIDLYSIYTVEEFEYSDYNQSQHSDYYFNLKSYLKTVTFKFPELFSEVPKNELEEQLSKSNPDKYNEKFSNVSFSQSEANDKRVWKGFFNSFKKMYKEEYYTGPFNKALDNDQFNLSLSGTPLEYLETDNFLKDEISEIYIEPGQEVTVVCYKDKNFNYAVGSLKNYETIKIYPGSDFNPRKIIIKENLSKILGILLCILFGGVLLLMLDVF